jgi:hypothetical protein
MPSRRTILGRARHVLDDYRLAELFTLDPPLLVAEGFYNPALPGRRCADQRDTAAMEALWREREGELVALWVHGWQPRSKFVAPFAPGKPRTRPIGWWRHCAPERRRRGESEPDYLDRLNLWLPGER